MGYPSLGSNIPLDGAVDVALNATISVTFVPNCTDPPQEIDPDTVTTASFTVNNGISNIAGVISTVDNVTFVFVPSASLIPNTVYTVTLKASMPNPIRNIQGGRLNGGDFNSVFSFTTVSSGGSAIGKIPLLRVGP